ncbi:hypothetical protein BCON_0084g00380 [Botryotinia convoluta]|uniref:Uncharacterized protein n=1 Tax=Botryotinia convoluta TaxID=54673 RepID=A0A4Z1IAQ7_9HELO|nr:hypothetical protein BCON_0084g00380 [Botryotinia convoluta]
MSLDNEVQASKPFSTAEAYALLVDPSPSTARFHLAVLTSSISVDSNRALISDVMEHDRRDSGN